MVDPAVITMVKDIVTILGVIGGFTYYVMTVRTAQKNQQLALEARQTQMFIEYHDKFISSLNTTYFELLEWEWDSYDDFLKKYGRPWPLTEEIKHQKLAKSFIDIFGYYEGLGVLVQTSDINIELIARFGGISIWDKFEPIVFEIRSRYGAHGAFGGFEELVIRVKEFYVSTTLFTDERASRKRRREALGMPTY